MAYSVLTLLVLVASLAMQLELSEACRKPDSWYVRPTWPIGSGIKGGATWRFRRSLGEPNEMMEKSFAICDTDHDQLVSLTEFKKCSLEMSSKARKTFGYLDTDGSGDLTQQEFLQLKVRMDGSKDCYKEMLLECGLLFTQYTRVTQADEDSMCGAMQEFVKCTVRKSKTCDMPEVSVFKHALAELVAGGEADGICPSVDVTGLGGQGSSLQTLDCSKAAILECDIDFISDLHEHADGCDALKAYDQCLDDVTKKCDDDVSRNSRAASHAILNTYSKLICPGAPN